MCCLVSTSTENLKRGNSFLRAISQTEPFSPQRSRRKEAARLYMALRGLAVSKDILLYSRDEFEHWKNSPNHVVGRAHREGRLLHARP
jgi:hypothetical protein